MNFKIKILKRMIAILSASIMTMSFVGPSALAIDTTNAEVEFALKYLDILPKKGDNFDEYLELESWGSLDGHREVQIRHLNGKTETVKINEKEIYDEIFAIVQMLIQKVEDRTPGSNAAKYGGKISKHYKLDKKMRVAKAIYRWVAKNISYDNESIKEDDNGNSLRKPQDAYFTFKQKSGICVGKSNLVRLMMRMAQIPCAVVDTIDGGQGTGHEFNAVFLEDAASGRSGWTLLDSTWGNPKKPGRMKRYFPGFYNPEMSIENVNRNMLVERSHRISDVYFASSGDYNKLGYHVNIGGVDYILSGVEGNARIKLVGNSWNVLKNVQIADSMAKIGMIFKIGKNIESLILRGDESLDVSRAYDLKSVDTTHSNKYDRYDRFHRKLIYKAEFLEKLRKPLIDKLKNFNEFEAFLKSIGVNPNEDSTKKIRQKALEFYNSIKNNLNEENVDKAVNLMDEAIKQMDKFKQDKLNKANNEKLSKNLNDKYKEFMKRWDSHVEFRKSIGKNSDPDFTYDARHAAEDGYKYAYKNLSEQNVEKAIKLMAEAIRQMDKFKQDNLNKANNEKLSKKLNERHEVFKKRVDEHKQIFWKDEVAKGGAFIDFVSSYIAKAENFYKSVSKNLSEQNVEKAIKLMDEAMKQMDKFKQDKLNKANNEKLSKKLNDKYKEFMKRWDSHVEFRKSIGKNSDPDFTYDARHAAEDGYKYAYKNLSEQNVEKAIKLMAEAIKQMDKFKQDKLNKANNEKLSKKLNDKYKEFMKRWDSHVEFRKSIGKNSDPDFTYDARHAAEDGYKYAYKNLSEQNVEKAIKLMAEAIKQMDKFKQDNLNKANNEKLSKKLNERYEVFKKRVDEHRIFRKSLSVAFVDFTLLYRIKADDFYKNISKNLSKQNIEKAINLMDEAIKQMDKFKKEKSEEQIKSDEEYAKKLQKKWNFKH